MPRNRHTHRARTGGATAVVAALALALGGCGVAIPGLGGDADVSTAPPPVEADYSYSDITLPSVFGDYYVQTDESLTGVDVPEWVPPEDPHKVSQSYALVVSASPQLLVSATHTTIRMEDAIAGMTDTETFGDFTCGSMGPEEFRCLTLLKDGLFKVTSDPSMKEDDPRGVPTSAAELAKIAKQALTVSVEGEPDPKPTDFTDVAAADISFPQEIGMVYSQKPDRRIKPPENAVAHAPYSNSATTQFEAATFNDVTADSAKADLTNVTLNRGVECGYAESGLAACVVELSDGVLYVTDSILRMKSINLISLFTAALLYELEHPQ